MNKHDFKIESVKKVPEETKVPDGGYGWVVLMASFMIGFVLIGALYSFGSVLIHIKAQFNVEDSVGNWLMSLNTGSMFCSGPIVAGLVNQFSCRVVVMVGAFVTSIMCVLTAFAPSIYVQMITHGIIGGFGTGCTFMASLMVILQYFDKKRGIATGIVMAGAGFGTGAFQPLVIWLLKIYDWKQTMIYIACFVMMCAVFGCLLRPLDKTVDKKHKTEEEQEAIETFIGSVVSVNAIDTEQMSKKRNLFVQIALNIIRDMTDFSLLKENKTFMLITISNFFVFLGFFVPIVYVPKILMDLEITQTDIVMGVIGIVNIPMRIIYGLLADSKILSAVNLNTLAVLFGTIPIILYYFLRTLILQIIFSVFFAIGIAGIQALTTLYVVELVGIKKFSSATGILCLFRGIACFIGSPIAGLIVTRTNNNFTAFFFTSAVFSIGLIIQVAISLASCRKK